MAGTIFLLLISAAFMTWRYLVRRPTAPIIDKIPGPAPDTFLRGNLPRFLSRHGSDFQRHVALDYGPVSKIHGILGRPILYISDPKALHHIIIKEEPIFQETSAFLKSNMLMFGPGLLSTAGDVHRRQRKMLNPAFSTVHMRSMIPIFYQVVHKLRNAVAKQVKEGSQEVDMLNWMGRTALELIGQGGLGYSFDPLTQDMQNEYGNALKSWFPNMQKVAMLRRFTPLFANMGPAWFRRFVLSLIPIAKIQKVKELVDTMTARSHEIFRGKKAALRRGDEELLRQVGEGRDIMSILIRENSGTSDTNRLPDEELIAQMSLLVLAATDTTSNSLSRMLQLLSEHPDVQEKLRQELLEAGAGDGLSYDELDQLPYLDSICRETLRVYPAAPVVIRVATKDTVLPLSEPIVGTDGTMISEIPISKGMEVIVGILGCNSSKALWGEDALEWKPERWLSPLPATVTKNTIPGVYSNLMTFIGGKRACIGFKFSEMEMKVVMSVLLSNFRFRSTDKPIEWNVGGVRYPTVGKIDNTPQLPLQVELLKDIKA
ncbi:uncharacterized protein FIBRA_01538 [Fibroporia radiculosa]|uniref:Cytochrome P450 n=1 Tax=Fibroporia radiculosa TaxID=599839 RepID=J4GKJ0_9APHY|nr:uncharacterized protein FIBRA_01538 [Fibroporia radiculosa]CCL99520.1 predicted protein [Fibroporia radiculosa]